MAVAQAPVPPQAHLGAAKKGRIANAVVIVFAILTALVALHRNGILFDLSKALGLESAYLGFERSVIGPPSILTPRGVQLLEPSPSAEPVTGRTAGGP
jgi:hypothetical protein